jgi:O-antigen ligase
VGILSKPFTTLLMEKYPNGGAYIPSTHSAWIEIALAFGYPGLLLTLGALVSIVCLSVSFAGPHQYLTSILSLGLILLYTVGEISSQHAIEMLCFLIALMSALLPSSDQAKTMKSGS